jgi:ubiquitin-protein ligase
MPATIFMRGRRNAAPNAACLLRLQRDLADITKEDAALVFPDPRRQQHFIARLRPTEGIWRDAIFEFDFEFPDEWPIQPPKVKILTPIWHPNMTPPPESGVCLNVLRKNYTPSLTLSTMIAALQFLFCDPNARDPLNFEAATQYLQNYAAFKIKAEEFVRIHCPKV